MKPHLLVALLALLVLSPALAACADSGSAQDSAAGGHILAPEDAWARVTSTPWQLVALDGVPPLAGTSVTLRIDGEARVTGKGGVNSYFGSVERSGAKGLAFSPLGATQMYGGDPPGIMEQETAYFRQLETVDAFRVRDDRLELLADGKPVLAFEAAPL